MTEMKGEKKDKTTITVNDFNNPFSVMDKSRLTSMPQRDRTFSSRPQYHKKASHTNFLVYQCI